LCSPIPASIKVFKKLAACGTAAKSQPQENDGAGYAGRYPTAQQKGNSKKEKQTTNQKSARAVASKQVFHLGKSVTHANYLL
jgi:hypothetical protein